MDDKDIELTENFYLKKELESLIKKREAKILDKLVGLHRDGNLTGYIASTHIAAIAEIRSMVYDVKTK